MQPPTKIEPKSLADYFEVLTKAVFQSGISWRVVEAKWDGIRQALFDLDPRASSRARPAGYRSADGGPSRHP
jgi:3-methyladenine DNA glycosylase Tag